VSQLPEITLLRAGVEITSGGGDNAYSNGGAVARTFTIRNDGVTNLNVGAISFANQLNCTVALTTAPAATVAPAGTSDFTITITPDAAGWLSFDMAIASDDADENPYDVHVVGLTASAKSGDDDEVDEGCTTGDHPGSSWFWLLPVLALSILARRRHDARA
jgi:MYXO-CTERM domain-containing protein